jgi:hypothetical protein
LVALDGTKIAANASLTAIKTYQAINAEMTQILAKAARADAAKNEQFGAARGDELPGELAARASRRARRARRPGLLERARRQMRTRLRRRRTRTAI